MDRNRFPEKYKTLAIIIPPDTHIITKQECPAPKHLSYGGCVKTMPGRIPHSK